MGLFDCPDIQYICWKFSSSFSDEVGKIDLSLNFPFLTCQFEFNLWYVRWIILLCRFKVITMRLLQTWCKQVFFFLFPWMGLCPFVLPMSLCSELFNLSSLLRKRMWT
ncbi:unnamed protein product, partial [Vitis vinifera]|uniref:Uncharacterized protein n=1 Tax=Vitis vinifera TaxID=29760 RepID=D7T3Z3_VITVI